MPVIVIPARDEGRTIGRTLSALAAQRGAPPFTVLVLANNCHDDTAQQALRWQSKLQLEICESILPPEQANVVGARRLALEIGAEFAGSDGIIVSTDADTEAHPDWLRQLLVPLSCGYDASAGRILLRREERAALPPLVRATHLLDTGYRMAAAQLRARLVPSAGEETPTHWQHFGANLALKISAYRAIGGLPKVSSLEDVALITALLRHDLRIRHTHAAKVFTSARLTGRVSVGLSTQLGEWSREPQHWRVPGSRELVAAAQAEELLRSGAATEKLAQAWRVDEGSAHAAQQALTPGVALELLTAAQSRAGHWHAEFAPRPVREALSEVRAVLAKMGGHGFQTVAHVTKGREVTRM